MRFYTDVEGVIYFRNHSVTLPAPKITWLAKVGEVFKFVFWAFVILLVVFLVILPIQEYADLSAGTNAFTKSGCLAAIDMESLDKYERAQKIGDTFGIVELLEQQRILSLDQRTSLLVLESEINWRGITNAFYRRHVRVLEGKFQGKTAWLPDTVLQPAKPTP